MRSLLVRLVIFAIFASALFAIIAYSRGYRINIGKKSLTPTGILVASSFPNGAKVYVNGELRGATDTNVQLAPGKYDIEIKKEGYVTWKKQMTVKGEIVVKTDSLLFPQNPSLSPVTSLGIVASFFSPNSNKAILITDNEDPEKNGIYVLETSRKALSIFNPLKLLAAKSIFPSTLLFEQSNVKFSPDGKQILLTVETSAETTITYLLSTDVETIQPLDVTRSQATILEAWQKEESRSLTKILETYKDPIPQVASDSFKIISTAPDDSKILYQATSEATLPLIITPPLIGANEKEQQRTLKKDGLYVYDKKEDKNYEIVLQTDEANAGKINNVKPKALEQKILWYPDSRHLVIDEENQVSIMDYDGGNRLVVYSGPHEREFLAVTTEGNLLILANLNPPKNKFPDVYTVGIR